MDIVRLLIPSKEVYNKIINTMTSHYKFVFLIIDSDGEACYDINRQIIRSFMHSFSDIKTLFVRFQPDQTDLIQLEGDTLFCRGTESFIPGVLQKTLIAMDYCLANLTFDFLIRTNLSTFWDFKRLVELYTSLQRSNCVWALVGNYQGIRYPSGDGIVCSRDVIQTILDHKTELKLDTHDDVAFGILLNTLHIPFLDGKRCDYTEDRTHAITRDTVHQEVTTGAYCRYRVKGWNRQYDNRIFQYLYNAIYTPYKSTAVTFYFNLKDLPDATDAVRPQSFYMEKGKETLRLQNPMVIFCDESTYPMIKSMRDELVTDSSLTEYIIKSFTDYDFYKDQYPIIRKNREGVPCYINDRNTSSYFLLCMFKILAIQIAYQKNFFKTPFYNWIDFGGSHVMRDFVTAATKSLQNPNPKISMCYIHYRSRSELQDRLQHRIQGGYCGIAGTSFSVEADYVSRFYNGCLSIFHEMLFQGIGHADEQVFNYFYDRYPDLCTIYYGDYYSILTNYHAPVEDYPSIRHFFINEAIHKGRRDLAKSCAEKVLKAVESGALTLDSGEIASLKAL